MDRPPSRSGAVGAGVGVGGTERVKEGGTIRNAGREGGWSCWGEGPGLGAQGWREQPARYLTVLPAHFPGCLGHPTSYHPSFQVAVIAGNFELGELIRNHREQDVGEWGRG